MTVDIKVKNAIYSARNITAVNISSDGRPRGSRKPISFDSQGIYIKKTGSTILGTVNSSLAITLEGGNPNWDGAFVQQGYNPYYTPAQISTLLNIVNLIKGIAPSAAIDSNGILGDV